MKVIEEFKRWLELQGYAKGKYPLLVRKFLRQIGNEDITIKVIEDYILSIKPSVSIGYVNNNIKAIRVFLRYLKLEIKTPPLLKPIKKLPDSISLKYFLEEVIPLAELTFETKFLQVKAILYLMFFTGLRKGEVKLLQRKHFDLKNRRIKVYAPKTKTERVVIFSKNITGVFIDYFQSEDEINNAFNVNETSIDYFFGTIKPYLKDCNFRPHLLRHSFCTYFAKNGMNMKYIKKLAGHKSLQTTEQYIDANIDNVQKAYDDIFNKEK